MVSVGDVFEVHINERPTVYARLEGIEADAKPGWLRTRLLLLTFPAQEVTWILRREYLEGAVFTMQNVPMRLVQLGRPKSGRPAVSAGHPNPGRVIPLRKGKGPGPEGGRPTTDD